MKWIDPSVEEFTQEHGDLDSIKRQIELAGRTSYKSFDRMDETSHEKFFKMLMGNQHGTPLEFGTVYLTIPYMSDDPEEESGANDILDFFEQNPYSRVKYGSVKDQPTAFVTTNMRVATDYYVMFDQFEIWNYMTEPSEQHAKRRSFRVVCAISTSRELNRHRALSIVEQSTRYCNYTKDKFGKEISCVPPYWLDPTKRDFCVMIYEKALVQAELSYRYLIDEGMKAQDARGVLPLDTATEVCYCGFEDDWEHFLSLRSPKAGATGVHPDAAIIGDKIYDLIHG